MPHINSQMIQEVKRMDLLTYLQRYNPHELIHFSGNTYTTRTHDSLKISNGKWCWWSEGIGGRTALDYLIKVRGFSFLEAVEMLAGDCKSIPSNRPKEAEKPKKLLLPKANEDTRLVTQYLESRGIHPVLIRYCIETGRIYESAGYHNAVFIGFDIRGEPKYASIRGTAGSDFKGEANGSDKHYSFCLPAGKECRLVHVFESAIDLLSYASLCSLDKVPWNTEHLLSLAGVYQPRKKVEESTMPAALMQFLKDHPGVKDITLHLDNDKAGRLAAQAIQSVLSKEYLVKNRFPAGGKDVNNALCMRMGRAQKVETERSVETR